MRMIKLVLMAEVGNILVPNFFSSHVLLIVIKTVTSGMQLAAAAKIAMTRIQILPPSVLNALRHLPPHRRLLEVAGVGTIVPPSFA
jgi:hypothetical protein